MTKNYTRREKAVIFLMTLDEGTVGQVLDSLEKREIQRVANYITKLEDVVFGMGGPKDSRAGIDNAFPPSGTDPEWSKLL